MLPVRRWTLDELDNWLLARLCHWWGGMDAIWRGKLALYATSNDHLFITNGEAVLLLVRQMHALSGKPFVMEIFAWARESEAKDGIYTAHRGTYANQALRALYKNARLWARGMKGTRVYLGVCSDLLPGELKEMLGDDSYYVVAGPP